MSHTSAQASTTNSTTCFSLGRVIATQGIAQLAESGTIKPMEYLARHARGDWGDVYQEDWQLNNRSVAGGGRLMSSYKIDECVTLWIITEWDRSVTTLLLPSEY